MSQRTDDLLRALIQVTARAAIKPEELKALVVSGSRNEKQARAYNLCDGTRAQAEIAKKLQLDSGNFSRTVSRWEQLGILFRVGEDGHLLHLYPL
jgi:DNA-binding MarR family transcriptional regulator